MPINKRQGRYNTCSPGYSFYTCATGFEGCCSQEACTDPDGCPEDKRDPKELGSATRDNSTESDLSTAEDTSTYSLRVNTPLRTVAGTSTSGVQSSSATKAASTSSAAPTGSRSSATSAAAGITPSTAPEDETSSPHSINSTPIIIGVVVGVVVAAIVIWLIWCGLKKRKNRIRDEATKPEREQWLQGTPESNQGLGISSDRGHNTAPHSPWSYTYQSKQDGSVPSSESSPNNQGLFPSPTVPSELSAEPSPKPELSPNPETLEINRAQYRSGLSSQGTPTTASHPSPAYPPQSTEMRPNLEVSDEEARRRGSHVMSWMSYGNGAAGPADGAG